MILALLWACGAEPVDTACADAPVVTWESQGEGLVVEHCQPCHSSGAENRYGAPASVTFDDHEQVLAWRERILEVATSEDPTMPPAVPLQQPDRDLLRIWLTCWE